MNGGLDRRKFLRLLAAVGAGTAAGCTGRKKEYVRARFEMPEEALPGTPTYYATTCRECPAGCGVWARTLMGRVVKLEGNPDHPVSQGALCARGQAALQGLYNPDRVTKPLARGDDGKLHEVSWDEAMRLLTEALGQRLSQKRADAVAWLTGETSDSDADLIEMLCERAKFRKPENLFLLSEAPLVQAAEKLFGYSGVPEFDLAAADMLVSVGADFLETWGNPVAQTLGFTRMHAFREGRVGRAVYIGPRQSLTAANCDEWIAISPGHEVIALVLILDGVLSQLQNAPSSSGVSKEEIEAARAALSRDVLGNAEQFAKESAVALRKVGAELAAAKAPLVAVSAMAAAPLSAQMLGLLITHLCGGTGRTLRFPNPSRPVRGSAFEQIHALARDVEAGKIEALLIHAANPAFLLPNTSEALRHAKFIAHFTTQLDETAATVAHLVLPIHHALEDWGNHAASAATVGLMQPAMQPLFDTRSFADVILALADALRSRLTNPLPWKDVRDYFDTHLEARQPAGNKPTPFEAFRRDVLRRGLVWNYADEPSVRIKSVEPAPLSEKPNSAGVAFFPHPFLFDGRGADKPWLQEVPESTTAIVWGGWAEIGPHNSKRMTSKGAVIDVQRGNSIITLPVHPTPQVMRNVIALPIGQGHTQMGRWAAGRGANPLTLADVPGEGWAWSLSEFRVVCKDKPGVSLPLIRTSGGEDQGNRELARAVTLDEARKALEPDREELPSLYPPHDHPEHQWAMAIDLDACVGCGACVVACYAENNIPVVGPKIVAQGREMSWIRVEKYVEGNRVQFLLNLCQHCHYAPCESVCPVHAAYHTDEGLNAQVYNRCVGTRYCSNNCPYKVRRFNWFDYKPTPPLELQLNPHVTVRERGVMEKCTFCVQRIREAKERAKNEGQPVRDGEVTPACAQTCPARALTFGDLKDPSSRVSKLVHDPRAYHLLGELGTRPSVVYLKKVLRV